MTPPKMAAFAWPEHARTQLVLQKLLSLNPACNDNNAPPEHQGGDPFALPQDKSLTGVMKI